LRKCGATVGFGAINFFRKRVIIRMICKRPI
jgi:hypothetical protein